MGSLDVSYNGSAVSEPHLGSGDANALLWEAAERAQNDRVYQAIHHMRADVNSKDWTLLQSRADVNAMDQTGETCLHWASANNNASMVELLIDSGASPDLRNRDGKLPCELSTMPLIQNICAPTPDEPWAATTQHVGPHDVKFAAIPGGGGDPEGQINTMLALIAAEQKARAHIQRKLMMLSELQRTLEDYKTHFARATMERKDTEQRLQAIRPQLERERRSREEAERELRDKRAQIEDLTKRLDDANEKILVARQFAAKINALKEDLERVQADRDKLREEIRVEQGIVDGLQTTKRSMETAARNDSNIMQRTDVMKQHKEAEKQELRDQIADLDDKTRALDKEGTGLTEQKKNLEQSYSKLHSAHTQSEKKEDESSNQRIKEENEKMKKESDLRDAERARDDLEKQVSAKKDRLKSLEEEYASLQQQARARGISVR